MTVGIVGSGNMGSAIARAAQKEMFGVGVHDRNPEKIKDPATTRTLDRVTMADLVVIAVKPQQFPDLAEQIRGVEMGKNSIVISIMAGIPLAHLAEELKTERVVRSMPNLAAAVEESMTIWIADKSLSEEDKRKVRELFDAMGKELEVEDEKMIDAATIVASCGPGWLYHLMTLFEQEAIALGFSSSDTSRIVHQMFVGAAEFAEEDHRSFAELRDAVASKGGVTEAGLAAFATYNLSGVLKNAFDAALKRSKELGK